MRGRLARASIVLTGTMLALSVPARAEGVYSGACTLDLTVTPTATLGLVPQQLTLAVDGAGTCVTNGGLTSIEFTADVATDPDTGGFACAGGLASGSGFVDLDLPGFSGLPVEVTVLAVGPAVSLVATAQVTRLDGLGLLTQDASDVAACPGSGVAATTWVGGFGFQDPELPAP